MRVWAYITMYFLPILCWSQEGKLEDSNASFNHFLDQFLLTDEENPATAEPLDDFLERLDRKHQQISDNAVFLSHLFSKVHYKFLKRYENYSSFSDLLNNGSYNCLTGTALYALLLERYGYQYSIVETTYHIFLLIDNDGTQILFEATDPREGFVMGAEAIDDKIRLYREDEDQISPTDESIYDFNARIFSTVTLKELKGLLYYNLAVDAFNERQFEKSLALLQLAAASYGSERIREFGLVIMKTMVNQELRTSEKVSRAHKQRSS